LARPRGLGPTEATALLLDAIGNWSSEIERERRTFEDQASRNNLPLLGAPELFSCRHDSTPTCSTYLVAPRLSAKFRQPAFRGDRAGQGVGRGPAPGSVTAPSSAAFVGAQAFRLFAFDCDRYS
jgi:hypothetical protein